MGGSTSPKPPGSETARPNRAGLDSLGGLDGPQTPGLGDGAAKPRRVGFTWGPRRPPSPRARRRRGFAAPSLGLRGRTLATIRSPGASGPSATQYTGVSGG